MEDKGRQGEERQTKGNTGREMDGMAGNGME